MTQRSHTELSRLELYELVWSTPVQRLSAKFGISDVALAKFCRRQQVPLPPRGYWARKAAGQQVVPTPLPEFIPPDPTPAGVAKERVPVRPDTQCAIYLVGHGPRREPRLIELQLVRIHRYMEALEATVNENFRLVETFIDLNWPRVNWWDPNSFPSFVHLHEAIQQKTLDTVFVDLEAGDPRNWVPYDSIVPYLRHSGVRVFNAYYDDENALKDEVERRFGAGSRSWLYDGPNDPSDIIAFFPALASAIAIETIDESERYGALGEAITRDLENLGRENPYAGSGHPFVDPRLARKMIDERIKSEKKDREARRESGERMFRVDRDSAPLLIDEHVWGGPSRTEGQLRWAEARLITELEFTRVVDGVVICYQREIDGFTIFADPREHGSLEFRVFRPPDAAVGSRRARKKIAPTYGSFKLPDTWKHDLLKKFEVLATQQIEQLGVR